MDLQGKEKDDGIGDDKISLGKVILKEGWVCAPNSKTKDVPLVVFKSSSYI